MKFKKKYGVTFKSNDSRDLITFKNGSTIKITNSRIIFIFNETTKKVHMSYIFQNKYFLNSKIRIFKNDNFIYFDVNNKAFAMNDSEIENTHSDKGIKKSKLNYFIKIINFALERTEFRHINSKKKKRKEVSY